VSHSNDLVYESPNTRSETNSAFALSPSSSSDSYSLYVTNSWFSDFLLTSLTADKLSAYLRFEFPSMALTVDECAIEVKGIL
jgi:hypothetical protein